MTSKKLIDDILDFYESKSNIKEVKLEFSSISINSSNLITISFYPIISKDPFDIIFVTVHWNDINGDVKNSEDNYVESWNMDVAYRLFDPDELKLFDMLGFKLSDKHHKATDQIVEDWFHFT